MMIKTIAKIIAPILRLLNFLTPVGDLAARLWVANVFFKSGLVKIQDWNSTINLFTYVYHVPLLPPNVAAVLGTAAELFLPILLIIGFGGRIVILIFFIYNIIAMISYHYLWTPAGMVGLDQHICWGLLLGMLMFHGAGKLSLDYWLHKRYGHHLLLEGEIEKELERKH